MKDFEGLVGALAAYVAVADPDGSGAFRVQFATRRAQALGFQIGAVVADAVVADDRGRLVNARQGLANAEAHTMSLTLREPHAPVRIEERVLERGEGGHPARLAGVVGEDSESPVESLRFLSDLLNTLPDPVFVKDRQHRWIAFNEGFCQFVGRSRAELLNHTDTDYFPAEQASVFWEHDDAVFKSGGIDENEEELTDAAGHVHVVSTRKAAFRDPDGQPVLVGVLRDVTAKKRVEEALISAARAKTEFVANISHELRTPLNGILGMTQLLARRPLGAVEQEYLDVITASGEALLALVDDVLDFSKIDAGRLELEAHPFSPSSVVEAACAVFAAAAAARGVELVVRCAADLPTLLLGDGARIRQIVINLVSNAVKFTAAGEVVVDARIDNGRLVIDVSDTGVGLDAYAKARLFTPFTQADASITRRFGGTGLGLAISQRLAKLMGGAIRAEGAPGHGSRFTFAAPARILDGAHPPAPLVRIHTAAVLLNNATARAQLVSELSRLGVSVLEEGAVDVTFVDEGAAAAPAAAPGQGVVVGVGTEASARPDARHLVKPVRRVRVEALLRALDGAPSVASHEAGLHGRALVVEDSDVSRKVLMLMLSHAGLSAEAARDGARGIAMLERERYDVVLMDCQMPELDGIETTRRVRAGVGRSKDSPIIAVTADATAEVVDRCLEAGMNAVVRKPVRVEELVEVLARFVPRAAAENR